MGSKIKIAITTGDNDGIGPEVVSKALCALGPIRDVQFILFRSKEMDSLFLRRIRNSFKVLEVQSLAQGLWTNNRANLIDIASSESAGQWVELAARLCMEGQLDALATGPLSKTEIIRAGLRDIGHTEILARVSGVKNLFMGFLGSKFCVVLATGHIPLARVPDSLNTSLLRQAIEAGDRLRTILPALKRKLPISVVGLNPHAGESGLMGAHEAWFQNVITGASKFNVHGPLVPDAAFLPENWKKYSVYICPYHDQGLIPFKMAHGFDEGVHITLGLPFVRTSVDHGTAKELVGKSKARHGSMLNALQVAIKLAKEKRK